MITRAAALLVMIVLSAPALAQQNQTPGNSDTGATQSQGGSQGKARHAQAGANTIDGTTTGVSGPKSSSSGPPGNLALPDLPSEKLCDSIPPDLRTDCLSTVLNQAGKPATGVQP